MSKRVTQRYTPEFRGEAVRLVLEQGLTAAEAATRLNMNQGTLAYWVTQARKEMKTTASVAGVPSAAELVAENKQLRKALAEARMESEVLKKPPFGAGPVPLNRNMGAYTGEANGQWPTAFWRHCDPVKKHGPGEVADPMLVANS